MRAAAVEYTSGWALERLRLQSIFLGADSFIFCVILLALRLTLPRAHGLLFATFPWRR